MSVVLQMSDTHFGAEPAVVVEALLPLLCAKRLDLVVLSGDITHMLVGTAASGDYPSAGPCYTS
jgi:3',5'-cyclic AMP phosphodiesterase CpdA